MDRMQLAIIGCGGMGGRHLYGLKALKDIGQCPFDLVGACDVWRDNAEYLAECAERLLGRRPQVFTTIEALAAALPGLQVVDVTTPNGTHHVVVAQAMELGWHVLCEKPVALTIRGANHMIEAQRRSGKVLSVAENHRRDPICRLTKALLDAGAIGTPWMLFHIGAGSGNGIMITHIASEEYSVGYVTSSAVHTTDLMQYYLGDIREIYARTREWEPIRYKASTRFVSRSYDHWYDQVPDQVEVTAEDTLVSVFEFESGAMGQWTVFLAGHGEGFNYGSVYGSAGSLRLAGVRNGRPVQLHRDDGPVPEDELLALVPEFHLDETMARLFGAERLTSYDHGFDQADAALIAAEYDELARCITAGVQPEVDAYVARKDLAAVYAAHESNLLGRPVTLQEIEEERTAVYEADINAHWGISRPGRF
jgi:predicted dehydrogenase